MSSGRFCNIFATKSEVFFTLPFLTNELLPYFWWLFEYARILSTLMRANPSTLCWVCFRRYLHIPWVFTEPSALRIIQGVVLIFVSLQSAWIYPETIAGLITTTNLRIYDSQTRFIFSLNYSSRLGLSHFLPASSHYCHYNLELKGCLDSNSMYLFT